MGSGKTTYAINKMNEDIKNNYIYITPFLNEVKRVKDECVTRKFYDPINYGKGKLESFHNLLKDGKTIISTHALFRMSNDVTRELIKANNYILILDEVCDVIEQIPLKKDDLHSILQYSHIEDNLLIWDDISYSGRYNDIKAMALNKTIIVVNNTLLMWSFPVEIFKSFKECFVMTYMFNCQIQKYYYDMYDLDCEFFTINNERKLIPYNKEDKNIKKELKKKIHILENDSINNIGDADYSLSVSWYNKSKNKPLISILKKNLYNYFQNKACAKSDQIIWTTFKDFQRKLSGKGYSKSFLACNARATNDYKERNILAYCINIFLNPLLKQFFNSRNIEVLEDDYALSELLQWIWRSAIREGNDIYIYIPSLRMRNLFIDWLQK